VLGCCVQVLWCAALDCVSGGDAVAADLASICAFLMPLSLGGRDGGVPVKGNFSTS